MEFLSFPKRGDGIPRTPRLKLHPITNGTTGSNTAKKYGLIFLANEFK